MCNFNIFSRTTRPIFECFISRKFWLLKFWILKTDNIHEFFSWLRYSTIGHAGTQGHLSCSRVGGGGGGALSTRAPTIINWKTKVKKIQFYFKNSSYQSFRYCFQILNPWSFYNSNFNDVIIHNRNRENFEGRSSSAFIWVNIKTNVLFVYLWGIGGSQ